MTLRDRLEAFASNGREASHIARELFDAVVVALRRDRRFAGISLQEAELLFADVHVDIERRLFVALRDRVRLDDVDGVEL